MTGAGGLPTLGLLRVLIPPHPTQQRFPKIPLLCLASRQMDVTHSTGSRMNGTFSGDIPAHLFPTPISRGTTSDER